VASHEIYIDVRISGPVVHAAHLRRHGAHDDQLSSPADNPAWSGYPVKALRKDLPSTLSIWRSKVLPSENELESEPLTSAI
jgi:hypothetical protein